MDEFIGIIKIFGGNFAPQGWMFCDGSLLPISEYEALYSLLGTTYGGDGQTTFALPNLCSRIPLGGGQGSAPGTQQIDLGQQGGEETHTLTQNEMPSHNHVTNASTANSSQSAATTNAAIGVPGTTASGSFVPTNGFNSAAPDITLNGLTVSTLGSGQAHNNMQPYLAVNYVICYDGVYPTPN